MTRRREENQRQGGKNQKRLKDIHPCKTKNKTWSYGPTNGQTKKEKNRVTTGKP